MPQATFEVVLVKPLVDFHACLTKILKENKIYFAELQTFENEIDYDYYHDTKINIHQLAQNLNLMMDRIATSDDIIMHRSWVQLTDCRM